jgi:hypothetical protein
VVFLFFLAFQSFPKEFCMKIAKGVSWFLFGCLSALVLAACINPVSSITEGRQQNASDGSAALTVKSVAYNREYEFLLLMGHWNRDYANESGDTYLYTPDLPTLLAAGKQTTKITAANNRVDTHVPPGGGHDLYQKHNNGGGETERSVVDSGVRLEAQLENK